RNEDLAGLDGERQECASFEAAAARDDRHGFTGRDSETCCVAFIDFNVCVFWMELAENIRFCGTSLRMPLGAAAATCKKQERKLRIGCLRHFARLFENEASLAVGVEELPVLK